MKRGAFALSAAVLVMVASSACGGTDPPAVRVGTLSDSRPNAYWDNGRFTGFDNELLRAVAAKEGLKLEFVGTDFSALLGQVRTGRFDIGSAAISQTEDRKAFLDFSIAYNYQALAIVSASGNAVTDERSLAGKRAGVVRGTVSDSWLSTNEPAATVIRFPDDAELLRALDDRTLDGAVFDQDSAEQYAAANPALVITKAFSTMVPQGYAVRKGNGELLRRINDGLRQVIAEGTWVRLHARYEPNEAVPKEFQGNT